MEAGGLQRRPNPKASSAPLPETTSAATLPVTNDMIGGLNKSMSSLKRSYSSISPKRQQEMVDKTVSVLQHVTPALEFVQKVRNMAEQL